MNTDLKIKENVILSTYAIVVSALILLCLLIVLYATKYHWEVFLSAGCIIILMALVLIYLPISISVDQNKLIVRRPLKSKTIPLSDISSVKLCPPTMDERRICGSGGFFGYWGWFSERDLGKYFAYYGKASDCFLVKLKDGKQYMLGCENPEEIVDFINKRI